MPFLTEIKALAERLEVINTTEVQGCTEAEIQSLEDALHIQLPEAYREFLGWIGKLRGALTTDNHGWRDNYLIDLQVGAQQILWENNFPQKLPSNAYVFSMHEGFIFYFFNLNGDDNPPLYSYMEGETEFRKEFCSFIEFLEYRMLFAYLVDQKSIKENFYWLKEQYTPCNK